MRDPYEPIPEGVMPLPSAAEAEAQAVTRAVQEQADDNGLFNTNPVAAANAITGIIAAVGSILVIGGYVKGSEVDAIKGAAGVIVPAAFVVVSTVAAIWGRAKAYSPKTAAKIAIANAEKPAGATPTLLPPP